MGNNWSYTDSHKQNGVVSCIVVGYMDPCQSPKAEALGSPRLKASYSMTITRQRILVAEDDPELANLLHQILSGHGFEVLLAQNGDEVVRMAQEQAPDLLLVDLMMPLMDGLEAIRQLRNDTRTAHLPMIIQTARSDPKEVVSGFESGADDYITKPYDYDAMIARIRGHLRRAAQLPVRNPLTNLPGNVLLHAELEHHLTNNDRFALMYIDLDNFKAFNDAYGFARGDRALHMLADMLVAVVPQEDFIGHVGGDDFVVIHPGQQVEELCQELIATFDTQVRALYDEEDLARGYLQGLDRQGVMRRFGLLSISIAVVSTYYRSFASVEDMSKVAAELKAVAKLTPGSSYEIDRRRHPADEAQPLERRGLHRPSALVLSDDQNLRSVIIQALDEQGYRSLQAADLLATHNILAYTPNPNLVVADARLGAGLPAMYAQIVSHPPLLLLVEQPQSSIFNYMATVPIQIALNPLAMVAGRVGEAVANLPALPPTTVVTGRVGEAVANIAAAPPTRVDTAETRKQLLELRRQTERFEHDEQHDKLTGLLNRRALRAVAEQLFLQTQLASLAGALMNPLAPFAQPATATMSVALAAIDQFAILTASLTLSMCDEVLQQVANIVTACCHSHTNIGRYSEEEFGIIFPSTSIHDAAALCEQLRSRVETYQWDSIAAGLTVTVSIGLACNTGFDECEQLLTMAKKLLHEAKTSGANQIRMLQPPR